MKRLFTSIIITLATLPMLAQGWPDNEEGVMLQGFYWNSYSDTQWTYMEKQVNNLAKVFKLVWLPQSAYCGGQSMGYDDLYWFPGEGRYNSSFGTEEELRSLIKTFEDKGIGTIADVVVNHRKNVSNWVDFPKETYKGVTYELKSTDICSDDDGGACGTWATQNGYTLGNPEEPSEVYNNENCEDWPGMRDLDHTSQNVQTNVKAYLHMLLEDLGYAGFRYDMVKGYPGKFTALYNKDAQPTYSVGEFWDGNASNCIKWLNATKDNGAIQSAVFDFPFRYTVRDAINNNDWTKLSNASVVSSNNGSYKRYAVTFVENHDTEYRSATDQQDPLRKDTLAANAYLLAMPGTPCVFLKHWQKYKQEIGNMVAVRKAVGITSMSQMIPMGSTKDYYVVQVLGNGGKMLLCVVGNTAASYTPTDPRWEKVISGYHYVYYVQGIEPSAITLPEFEEVEQPQDGTYSGIPSFCKLNAGEICAFFEAPVSWVSLIYTWAWMNGGDGKDYVGTSWPGVVATYVGTADNGNKVYKWTTTKTTAPDNIIFSSGGNKTADLPFANGGYYTKDGRQGVVTGISELRMKADNVTSEACYNLSGQRVIPQTKGIYIINGKKYVK
jgi:alpha-amylase